MSLDIREDDDKTYNHVRQHRVVAKKRTGNMQARTAKGAAHCVHGFNRSTTPTAAIEMILGLTPLHIDIQIEARKGQQRLLVNGIWSDSKPMTRHTRTKTDDNLARYMDATKCYQRTSSKGTTVFMYQRETSGEVA